MAIKWQRHVGVTHLLKLFKQLAPLCLSGITFTLVAIDVLQSLGNGSIVGRALKQLLVYVLELVTEQISPAARNFLLSEILLHGADPGTQQRY